MRKYAKYILIFILLVGLDQLIKFFLLNFNPGIISLNSGGAFGFANGILLYKYFVIIILFVLVFILWKTGLLIKYPMPTVLIYSGAISGLIDRLRLDGVVDYINFKIWPSFNLADILIVAGTIWLAYIFLRSEFSS